ncbi:MAG: HD domain-containing phosphohydrolase [Candidatus Acetothermia bacterium]
MNFPLSSNYGGNGAITVRLEYEGRVYGLLSASVPIPVIENREEQQLFKEVGDDIALSLHELELRKDLLYSERKFRSYVENAPVGVYVVDDESNFQETNEAIRQLTGYSEEELLKMKVPDLHPPEAVEKAQRHFKELQRNGKVEMELPYIRKDGKEGYMIFSAVRLSEQCYLGIAMDATSRKEAEKKLQKTTLETLEALNRTIEAKDEYTGDHIDRVQEFSVRIGEKMNLSEDRLEQLRYASILHDIGKIQVPDSVLVKDGKLTEEEWKKMEKHPEIGEEIVSQVDQLERAAKIIGQHQEKYDGSGYPKGLEGEDITLEARIIAVADAWNAMRTDRPYRDALQKEVAISELKENAGTQFDPEVVDILLKLVRKR